MHKLIYKVTDGLKCCLKSPHRVGAPRKRSGREWLGTSDLVLVVCSFAERSVCCGFISLAHPAPASSGSPEPTVHGDSAGSQVKAPSPGRGGRSWQLRFPALRTKDSTKIRQGHADRHRALIRNESKAPLHRNGRCQRKCEESEGCRALPTSRTCLHSSRGSSAAGCGPRSI